MNERLTLLSGALVAVAIVVGLLVPSPAQRDRDTPTSPTSADRGAHGLAGAKAWLEARGVATTSLRVRYDGLRRLDAPPEGNLLVIHLPRLRAARPNELEALRQWLRRGNTAIVLAAIAHEPRWALGRAEPVSEGLDGLDLALKRDPDREPVGPSGDAKETVRLTPVAPHPITASIDALRVGAPFQPVQRPEAGATPWLGLFGRAERPSIFWRHYGAGAILVSAHPGLFGNDAIRRADNAQLLANIVARSTEGKGRVIFDDFHLGLSRLYDAQAFFADPRLHATLAFLIAFWLLYTVGHSNRLAPPRRRDTQATAGSFAETVAGLLARRCDRSAVARTLLCHFFDTVRQRHGLPCNGEPAWDELDAHRGIDAARLARVQRMAHRLERGRRVSLARLNREIVHLQERLR